MTNQLKAGKLISSGLSIANEAALIEKDLFMWRFEVRKPDLLVMPPTAKQENFSFPKKSVYHFVSLDPLVKGPSDTDPHLSNIDKKMSVEHVRELSIVAGSPMQQGINLQTEIDTWHRTKKRFRKTRDTLAETTNDNVPAIFSYGFAQVPYRYTRSIFTERYKWLNLWATVFDKIAACKDNPRSHFVFIPMPTHLPSLSKMDNAVGKPETSFLQLMRNSDEWMVFDLWQWMNRELRSLTLIGRVPKEMLSKVDLVFEDSGRFMCLNLGLLDSWIEDPTRPKGNLQEFHHRDLQKRLLRGFMTLMEYRSGTITIDEITSDNFAEVPESERVQPPATAQSETNVSETESVSDRTKDILDNMDADLKELENIEGKIAAKDAQPNLFGGLQDTAVPIEPTTIDESLLLKLDDLAESGLITASNYRSLAKAIDKAAVAPSPYKPEVTAREYAAVKPEETSIKEVSKVSDDLTIIDKSMLDASLKDVDRIYIDEFLNRDKVAMVQAIQKGGNIVTDHKVTVLEDAIGKFEAHEIKLQPLEGLPSPIRLKVPIVDSDNRIRTGNTSYVMRRQRVDKPIRKISSHQVALSSYYGKNFVNRTEKSAYDYAKYLVREVNLNLMSETPTITNIATGNVFNHLVALPRSYTALAGYWRSFVCKGVTFHFDYNNKEKFFDKDRIAAIEALGMTPVGIRGSSHYGLDMDNTLYLCEEGDAQPISSIEEFLDLRVGKKPVEFCECKLLGKAIPVGLVLGYYYGLSGLIKQLNINVRQVPAGQRVNLQTSEWSLVFDDMTLVFSQEDRLATLVLGGLQQIDNVLKKYTVAHFDERAVYFNCIEGLGLNARYMRELDLLQTYFVDPITERVLKKMGEPTSYQKLVMRSCEMLLTDHHKKAGDNSEQRYRGAERIAGNIYTAMITGLREHAAMINKRNARVNVHPYAVWEGVMGDNTIVQSKDINPIQNLKENEAITFMGAGGRSERAITRSNRYYDKSDKGIISEAGVDSKLTGVNVFTSASPRFSDLEGMVEPTLGNETPMTSLLSTTAMLSPAIMKDDIKRAGFASIQHSHGIACDSYEPLPLRTGYEATMASRVDEGFAATAAKSGVVKSVTAHGIQIEYDDGTTQGFSIGRRFGNAGGITFPHDLVPNVKEGEKVNAGDVILYHKGFFKPDRFNPKVVRWMNGTTATVALLESNQTHEDACSVSAEFAKKVSTRLTQVKHITVAFDQEVRDLVKIGQQIEHHNELCKLEDSVTSNAKLFSEETLNTLRSLSGKAPTAKVSGTVDDIVVYYHGDIQDMTESLQQVVQESDKRLRKKLTQAGKPVHSGSVDEGYRIDGEPLLLDMADIVIYITHEVPLGLADKGVFGLQLKTETSEVFSYPVRAVDGTKIDAIFGGKSVFDRIVGSAYEIGTTITLLKLIGRKAGAMYKGLSQ